VAFTILSFQCACDFAQGLEVGCGELRDTDPSVDASRWEVSHASNGVTQMQEETEREGCVVYRAARKQGMGVPTRSTSSGDGEME
jgi:hypothetical protein